MAIMLFPFILKMLGYIFLLSSITNKPYQWKVLPDGLGIAPRVFTILTKALLFLCHHKGFCYFYLNDVMVHMHSKCASQRAQTLFCSLLVHLRLTIKFFKSELIPENSCNNFLFGTVLEFKTHICLSTI